MCNYVCCGIELGKCDSQMLYDMENHDKLIYQQGREDAFNELYMHLFESILDGDLKDDQIMYEIRRYVEQMKGEKDEG